MDTKLDFCTVNADKVPIDKLMKDLENYSMEAHVAGYQNLTTEIHDGKLWIVGEKNG